MKATLYKLKEGYVLCKKDPIAIGEKYIDDTFTIRIAIVDDEEYWEKRKGYLKVLTKSPDFSLLSEKDAKRIGWFDVDRMANTDCNELTYNDYKHLCIRGYKVGFKKALELTGRFTEEQVENLLIELSTETATEDGSLSDGSPAKIFRWVKDKLSQHWEVEYKEENGVYKVLSIV
jgi:hypothetical protein